MRILEIPLSIIAFLITGLTFCQVSGTILDESNGLPIPYVNVWIKNTRIGATTGENGKFSIEGAKIGDTILISSLGYANIEFLAEKENNVELEVEINQLTEVVIIPMKNSAEFSIISFKKVNKNRNWYNNGHYSLARFYERKPDYNKTPFLDQISLITLNTKKKKVVFRLRLVEVGANGEPSENGLSENIILESKSGVHQITLDLKAEKILFPRNGFFIVLDRLNLEENYSFNKIAKIDILQPAIGMERTEQEKNTWFGFGGKWIPPSEMKTFLGTNGNIAVNIKLTN